MDGRLAPARHGSRCPMGAPNEGRDVSGGRGGGERILSAHGPGSEIPGTAGRGPHPGKDVWPAASNNVSARRLSPGARQIRAMGRAGRPWPPISTARCSSRATASTTPPAPARTGRTVNRATRVPERPQARPLAQPRSGRDKGFREWSQPGSNRRPPACKPMFMGSLQATLDHPNPFRILMLRGLLGFFSGDGITGNHSRSFRAVHAACTHHLTPGGTKWPRSPRLRSSPTL